MTPPKQPATNGAGTNIVPIRTRGGPVTRKAWRAYVETERLRPKPVSAKTYANAAPQQRRRFDLERKRYHRSLGDFQTRAMVETHHEIDSRVDGNDGCPPTARNGVIINGHPLMGKSTILLRWGSAYERQLRRDEGVDFDARTEDGALFVPVVFVLLGKEDGPKGFCQRLMRFYGQKYRESWDAGELTDRIQDLAVSSATSVVMIDQMQNLRMSNRSARQTAAHLKELMDVLPVTILGAGVNMETTGFYDEGHARDGNITQIAGRFANVQIERPDLATIQGATDWHSLIATVSDRLILLGARENDLTKYTDYLYERTGGVTGDVMDLLRQSANQAVGGPERITKTLLDSITLSRAAEQRDPSVEAAALTRADDSAAIIGAAVRRVRNLK